MERMWANEPGEYSVGILINKQLGGELVAQMDVAGELLDLPHRLVALLGKYCDPTKWYEGKHYEVTFAYRCTGLRSSEEQTSYTDLDIEITGVTIRDMSGVIAYRLGAGEHANAFWKFTYKYILDDAHEQEWSKPTVLKGGVE